MIISCTCDVLLLLQSQLHIVTNVIILRAGTVPGKTLEVTDLNLSFYNKENRFRKVTQPV